MEGESILLQALVYLGAAVISVPIAKRLGLGSVLGYLVAGAIIGPFALNWVGDPEDVMRVGEFGVVILLFLIGLELRPALLWRTKGAIFGLGGGQLVLTTLALAAAALALGLDWRMALAIGVMLAMSSTALVLQTLDERGLRTATVGRSAFGVLLMQDLAVIPLFALLPLLATLPADGHAAAGHAPSVLADAPPWVQTLGVLGAVAAVIVAGLFLTRPMFRFIAAARLREIFTASALLLVVGVATLMQLVGLSPALGAFLAGVVLAESEFRRELETDIEPFRGLLLGLFFITVGASLDFAIIALRPWTIVGLVLGLFAIKFAVMLGVAKVAGHRIRDAATTAIFLAQGGEFAFVLITFTVGAGVVDPAMSRLLAAVVAVSMAISPLLVGAYLWLLEKKTVGDIRAEPENDAFTDRPPQIIVAGFGRFGQIADRLLVANGYETVTLDSSIEQIELLRGFGRKVYYGDASRLDLLRQAGAERARLLLVAIDDKERSIEMVEAAREAFPDLTIIARAWDRRHAYELLRAGADEVERETFEGGLVLGRKALRALGMTAAQAARAADVFRKHDKKAFDQLAPLWGDEDRYRLAARANFETMEKLLAADTAALKAEDAREAEGAACGQRV